MIWNMWTVESLVCWFHMLTCGMANSHTVNFLLCFLKVWFGFGVDDIKRGDLFDMYVNLP